MKIERSEVCTSTQKESYLSWCFENIGLVVSIRDGVLKMIKGSMVVMKSVRRNNLCYLKGSTITGQVKTSFLQMMFVQRPSRLGSDTKEKSLCKL